ncbi:MAG TPA: hypothetical protein VFW28_02740 [Micropepsaceae bacterium]|nr:hypothetical protein [Micropepsaceae bacterium]
MPFKPNYHQERASRDRVKNERKQEKLRKREAAAAERKAARETSPEPGDPQTPDEV